MLSCLASLQGLAETQLAEVPQAAQAQLADVGDLEGVDHRELQRRVEAGEVVLLDVRPAEECAASQACGACLKVRNQGGSMFCPLSSMQTLYDLIAGADPIVSF